MCFLYHCAAFKYSSIYSLVIRSRRFDQPAAGMLIQSLSQCGHEHVGARYAHTLSRFPHPPPPPPSSPPPLHFFSLPLMWLLSPVSRGCMPPSLAFMPPAVHLPHGAISWDTDSSYSSSSSFAPCLQSSHADYRTNCDPPPHHTPPPPPLPHTPIARPPSLPFLMNDKISTIGSACW